MANDIICEISSENELICEMSSAGEIVVEINGMTYQSVAAELAEKASVEDVALKADKTYVDSQDALKADKTYVDSQNLLKADKTYVDTKLSEKANKQQEAWITPTLLNGWTGSAKYFKDNMGYVYIEINSTAGANAYNTIILELPQGYRPSVNTGGYFRDGTAGTVIAQLTAITSGTLRVASGVTSGRIITGSLKYYGGVS